MVLIAIVLVTVVKIALVRDTVDGLDWIIVAAFLLMVVASVYQLVTRKWREAIGSLALAVILLFVTFLAMGTSLGFHAANQPWTWNSAEATLPDGMGTVTVYERSLDPSSFFPVPGNDHMWKVAICAKGHPPRTFRLRDLISEDPNLEIFLIEADQQRVLDLFDGEDNLYIDLKLAGKTGRLDGPSRKLGTFCSDGHEYRLQFVPYYERPRANGELFWPASVAVDGKGNVYAADAGNDLLAKYSPQGKFITKWPLDGLHYLYDIAVDNSGYVWVINWGGRSILRKYSTDGKLLAEYGGPSEAQVRGEPTSPYWRSQFDSASGLACGPNGNVYVTEIIGQVQKVAPDGKLVAKWGHVSHSSWRDFDPCGVAMTPDGSVLIANRGGRRIQKYTPNGQLMREWRGHSHGLTGYGYPVDVTVDGDGNIYAAVWYKREFYVEKSAPDGDFLLRWKPAIGVQTQTCAPVRIAASAEHVYVADEANHRILKFTSEGIPMPNWGS